MAAFVGAVAVAAGAPSAHPGELDTALRHALAAEGGVSIDASDPLHWIDAPGLRRACWRGGARVALLARSSNADARDVYLARVESSPEGAFVRLCGISNLTRTTLADETRLAGVGSRLAWTLEAQGLTYRLETADLDAHDPSEIGSWSALARWQWRLAGWQQTGQLAPIARRSFRIEPAAGRVTLAWLPGGIAIAADGREVTLSDGAGVQPAPGDRTELDPLREESRALARPGNLLTWAVDRARASPRVGSERLQWIKAAAFALEARLERLLRRAAPAALAEERERAPLPSAASPSASIAADASTGGSWAPQPITPLWSPALEGEGQWRSLDGDAFVRQHPGLGAPFTTTFIRPDRTLETARVIVVLWDPRRVELHFVAGTEEPLSATGEIGAGLIPRTPRVLSRLLGAFNGGFQSVHGGFGTQVGGRLLVPPRPYAATVARFNDGAIGLGTWPLSTLVPPEIDSFRQNLTPLVADGVLNPYGRQWWGGVPLGWKDVTRTVRSALCETREGLLAYFYGSRVDHEALGSALALARCRYGLHLDMNAGHTGFEFYTVLPQSEPALPADALDAQWKTEAPVSEVPELRFRARRLFRNMQLMHFPRYIERQSRDFFYLTERTLLPLAHPPGQAPGNAAQPVALATHSGGFPQLVSMASVHPDTERPQTEVRLLALDLKWLSLALSAAGPVPKGSVLSLAPPSEPRDGGQDPQRVLWVGRHRAQIGAPGGGGHVVAREARSGADAAWGLIDHEILIYAEVVMGRNDARDAALLDGVLAQAGASERLLTSAPNFIAIKGETDLRGARVDLEARAAHGEAALHFQPDAWQALRPLFADTPVVDPETWQPHQVESSE